MTLWDLLCDSQVRCLPQSLQIDMIELQRTSEKTDTARLRNQPVVTEPRSAAAKIPNSVNGSRGYFQSANLLLKKKSHLWALSSEEAKCNCLHSRKSKFIWHQPLPPCPLSSTSMRSKLYTGGSPVGNQCHVCLRPQDQPPESVSKKGWFWHCQGKRWLEGSEDNSETNHSEHTGPV